MASSLSHLLMAFLSVAVLVNGRVLRDDPAPAETKIVGGKEIEISKAPWQVYLNDGCGGSIISAQWVLTAAHCTVDLTPDDIWMLVGTNSIEKKEPRYYVEEVINHENYDLPTKFDNDISLLKSKTVLNLDGRPLRAVTLPGLGATRPPVDTQLQVTGWGWTENSEYSNILKAVDIRIRDYSECQSYGSNETLQICAYLPGKGACNRDSGGPVVLGEVIVGIVSYGDHQPCGVNPGIYTDVAAYREWIKGKTGL